MVQNNKVLTVSYGTFSCTLEGFDDSFDTMKAIAEYFRDLAADDRYFGAEPPQPDAEMMARIAQREIARQVEARSSDTGIHLRAAAPAVSAPAAAPSAEAQPAAAQASPEPTPVAQPAPPAPTALAPSTPAPQPKPVESPVMWGLNTSLTAAGAVAPQTARPVEPKPAPQPVEEPASTVEDDIDTLDGTLDAMDLSDLDLSGEEDAAETSVADDPALFEPMKPATTTSNGDSIAAKLQRIRAVVAKTPVVEEDDFTEDEHADGVTPSDLAALEEVLTSAQADEDYEDEAPAAAPAEDDSLTAMLDRIAQGGMTTSRVKAPLVTEAADEDEDEEEDASDLLASIAAEFAEDDEDEIVEDDSDEAALAELDALTTPVAAQDEDEAEDEADDAAPTAEAAPVVPRRPARGRIIRVKRAEVEANFIDATAEEVAPAPVEETPAPKPSSLSDDDEADLMAELAAVEAELVASTSDLVEADADLDDEFDEDDTLAEAAAPVARQPEPAQPAPQEPAASGRTILGASAGSPDGDVSRLMAAADHRLSEEQARSSRETYNQLRAAVAAAQADPDPQDNVRREARARAFRDDLASVVKPTRAETSGNDARPVSPSRPAPLKLVAEQRIDARPSAEPDEVPLAARATAQATAAAAPVRPRRVSSALLQQEGDDVPPARDEDSAFASYAAEKGAVELNELLEAAASYMSFVEGRESFSRPQLINKVRMLDGQDGFNREDSLRSFGMLLREGKLKKASNGRFSVSSQIGFRPGNRAAG